MKSKGVDSRDPLLKSLVKQLNRQLLQRQSEWQSRVDDERQRHRGAELRSQRTHSDELDRLHIANDDSMDALRQAYDERVEQLDALVASLRERVLAFEELEEGKKAGAQSVEAQVESTQTQNRPVQTSSFV